MSNKALPYNKNAPLSPAENVVCNEGFTSGSRTETLTPIDNNTSDILHPFPPRVVSLSVYATPYAFTANNQPLYLRYGTIRAAEAADAAYYILSSNTKVSGERIQQNNNCQVVVQNQCNFHNSDTFNKPDSENGTVKLDKEKLGAFGPFTGDTGRNPKAYVSEADSEPNFSRHDDQHPNGSPNTNIVADHIFPQMMSHPAEPGLDKPINKIHALGQEKKEINREQLAECHSKRQKRSATASSTLKTSSANSNSMDEHLARRGRMVWVPELHELFLNAVQKIGLEKAVPTTILHEMQSMKVTGLSRDNVASHLQKFRLGIQKEKEENEKKNLFKEREELCREKERLLIKINERSDDRRSDY